MKYLKIQLSTEWPQKNELVVPATMKHWTSENYKRGLHFT